MRDIISGKYEILSQVGRGGMGVVYKVRHRTLETLLALKVLPAELAEDADLVRRFHQEARVMAQLRHPNIVHVLDVDRDGDTHFFVMEYVEGKSLSQFLRERKRLPLSELLIVSKQIAQALDYAHKHQPPVIHRDIKPANILIEEGSKRVVVTDFGIAKVLGTPDRTRPGLVMGTLRYCAPEQILQDQEIDGRADIYSLGLVMYEMAVGRPFFTELDERALLGQVLHRVGENVPIFSEPILPEFAALVTRAITRERERRYSQASELLVDIEMCLTLEPATAPTIRLEETIPQSQKQTSSEKDSSTFNYRGGVSSRHKHAALDPLHPGESEKQRERQQSSLTPIHLTILRKENTHIIDLASVEPLIPRSETRVEQSFLDEICTEMQRIALLSTHDHPHGTPEASLHLGNRAGKILSELQGIGGLIFSHLLTQPARERLRSVAPCDLYLRLDDQLVQVPWELCFDGVEFLATKFRIGRQVITQYAGQYARSRSPLPGEKFRILIIADPTESLAGVTEEVEQLCTLLDEVPSVEVTLLGGSKVRKIALLSSLSQAEVVHFAGHSVFDTQNPQASGWLLHEGVLTASEIAKLDRPPLLVFSNSCQAGTTTTWQKRAYYEGDAFGLGSAFLLAGVKSFIGTFWVVHDQESVLFAGEFYRAFLDGQSLGESLLRARRKVIESRGWESLTWAGYALYGDPVFRLNGSQADIQANEKIKDERAKVHPPPPSTEDSKKQASRAKTWSFGLLTALLLLSGVALFTITPERWTAFSQSFTQRFLTPVPVPLLNEYRIAYQEFAKGEVTTARTHFARLADAAENPQGFGFDGLATIYFEAGLMEKAGEILRQARDRGRINPMLDLIEGDLYASRGETDKALDSYRLAVATRSVLAWQNAAAHNALGLLYFYKGLIQEAQEEFVQAISTHPNDLAAYSNLGVLYWQKGEVSQARQMFDKVLSLNSGDVMAQYFLKKLEEKAENPMQQRNGVQVSMFPFVQAGGIVRRLGYSEVLWSFIQKALAKENQNISFIEQAENWRHGQFGPLTVADTNTALSIAQKENSELVVFGAYERYTNAFTVDARVVKTQGAELLATIRLRTEGQDSLQMAAEQFAQKLNLTLAKPTRMDDRP